MILPILCSLALLVIGFSMTWFGGYVVAKTDWWKIPGEAKSPAPPLAILSAVATSLAVPMVMYNVGYNSGTGVAKSSNDLVLYGVYERVGEIIEVPANEDTKLFYCVLKDQAGMQRLYGLDEQPPLLSKALPNESGALYLEAYGLAKPTE